MDWGTWNDDHDAIDTTDDGKWDVREISEPFDDFGLDGQRDTFDEGEGDGEWNGYHMINCEAVVKTDKMVKLGFERNFPGNYASGRAQMTRVVIAPLRILHRQ
ncbi:MAG: hypothetical protein Ct9H300mP9_8370 [Candidatus Neomarinimicrobiota bacterium]|nr:MAG: hypothetical protein Ct9H300mP9_8370 [Candidatus Neomarinimicrobiota bacterium]